MLAVPILLAAISFMWKDDFIFELDGVQFRLVRLPILLAPLGVTGVAGALPLTLEARDRSPENDGILLPSDNRFFGEVARAEVRLNFDSSR